MLVLFRTLFAYVSHMDAIVSIYCRYYSERFIVNVTPCFLRAVQFSFSLLCMGLLVLKMNSRPQSVNNIHLGHLVRSKLSTWLMFRVFSSCVINMLLRIVESGSTLSNKIWLCCLFVKLTTCHA